jgi:hypothetical protein
LHLRDGRVLYIVSREARVQAFVDAEAVQEQCGGFISVQSVREPTEVPGEMVTTMLVCEWRDRTDAKEQPEARQAPIVEPAPVAVPAEADAHPMAADFNSGQVELDGLDPSTLQEEDLSSMPEPAR